MFCPFCGVKNEFGQQQCFVCRKKLPSLDADAPGPKSRPVPLKAGNGAPAPARLGDRMIAVFFDTALIAALLLPAAAYVATQVKSVDLAQFSIQGLAAAAGIALILLTFLYYWIQEGAFGTTIGKAIIGLQVTRIGRSGTAGFRSAAIRNAFRLIEGLPLYFPGFLVALFSNRRRRLGDYAAETQVMEVPMHPAGRAAVVLLWIAAMFAAIWGTWFIAPEWFRLRLP